MCKLQSRFTISLEPLVGGDQVVVSIEDCWNNKTHSYYLPDELPLKRMLQVAETYIKGLNEANMAKKKAMFPEPHTTNLGF